MTTPRFRLCSKRGLAPVSVVTVLAVLCLSFSATSSAATSPQAQVRAAWTKFKDSLVTRNASAFCASLTAHASRQLIADVTSPPRPTSCQAAAARVLKIAGGRSVAHIRLLSVHVSGNTAKTTDTAGPPAAPWVRTGPSTWKIAYLPPSL